MTQDCFDAQIKRLKLRFGDRAFDGEFTKLIGKEVYSLTDFDFVDMVDLIISTRNHTRPPTIIDFREHRIQIEKKRLSKAVNEVNQVLTKSTKKLTEILSDLGYNGCDSIMDAIEVERIKLLVNKADSDPDGAA